MPLQLNLPCRMMGKAGPPLTPSVPPQLHACSCFPSSSPPLQALPHNLALGHLLQIRAGSQTRTRGSSPACAYQCRLLAAIRAGGESLLSQLLPDPRVMKVGFKGAEIVPGRGSKRPACSRSGRCAVLAEAMLSLQGCRNCISIQMQLVLPGERGAASVPTDLFTCLEVESVQYLAGSAGLINLFNNDA